MRMCSLKQVYKAIVKQFKKHASVALQSLQNSWYTMNDAHNGKAPQAHFMEFLQHVKAAEFTSVYNQLILSWNSLSLDFQHNIPELMLTMSLWQFLDLIDLKINLWLEMTWHNCGGEGMLSHNLNKMSKTDRKNKGWDRGGRLFNRQNYVPYYDQPPVSVSYFPSSYKQYDANDCYNQSQQDVSW